MSSTVTITTKDNDTKLENVKFYAFERNFVNVVLENGNKSYFKTSTILKLEEVKDEKN